MRVVHLSISDIGFGAGVAAFRLHCALKQAGVHSQMLVSYKLSEDCDVFAIDAAGGRMFRRFRLPVDWAESALTRLGPQNWLGSNELLLRFSNVLADADIVNLHAIHWRRRYIPYRILSWLAERKPVVWTQHDMWALTGHCVYSYECDRWKIGCGDCPDLKSFMRIDWDVTRASVRAKRGVYQNTRFTVVSPSRWLADVARASPLFAHVPVRRIPYGVDLSIYAPLPKEEARRIFGLAPDASVIATIAHDFRDRRKGAVYFERAMLELPRQHDGATLLCIGHGDPGAALRERFNVVKTGFISNPQVLVAAYSAADFLVVSTIADNLPNVILESLACATPVVSFQVGGVPDMVHHLENGYLAPLRDHSALSQGIDRLLSNCDECRAMGAAGRRSMQSEFSFLGQANAYRELYETLLQ